MQNELEKMLKRTVEQTETARGDNYVCHHFTLQLS